MIKAINWYGKNADEIYYHFNSRRDTVFHLNDAEIIGEVFGLKYVYHFLHVHRWLERE